MKYKAVYDVLNERRQTTPGFCYHDRSGWRAYPQTYMTMQCPLWIIAEDAATGRRLWITQEGTRFILYPEVAEQLRLQIETIDALYPDDQLVLGGVHGFVFRNRTGSFMSAHNINRAIERISVTYNMEEMDQAELEDREPDLLPHFSVHNLRHTFCTRLCESTNDVKFIQQVMGHADFSTTMDIYTHITQENMQEKAKNISVNMKLM